MNNSTTDTDEGGSELSPEDAAYFRQIEELKLTTLHGYKIYLPFVEDLRKKCKGPRGDGFQLLLNIINRASKVNEANQIVRVRNVLELLKNSFKIQWAKFLKTLKKRIHLIPRPPSEDTTHPTSTITAPTTTVASAHSQTTVGSSSRSTRINSSSANEQTQDVSASRRSSGHESSERTVFTTVTEYPVSSTMEYNLDDSLTETVWFESDLDTHDYGNCTWTNHHRPSEHQQSYRERDPYSTNYPPQPMPSNPTHFSDKSPSEDLRHQLDEKRRLKNHNQKPTTFKESDAKDFTIEVEEVRRVTKAADIDQDDKSKDLRIELEERRRRKSHVFNEADKSKDLRIELEQRRRRKSNFFDEKLSPDNFTDDPASEFHIKKCEDNILNLINKKHKNSANYQNLVAKRSSPKHELSSTRKEITNTTREPNHKWPRITFADTLKNEPLKRKHEDYMDTSSSSVIMNKRIAIETNSLPPKPMTKTNVKTKPIESPVNKSECSLTSALDEVMAPVREKNLKTRPMVTSTDKRTIESPKHNHLPEKKLKMEASQECILKQKSVPDQKSKLKPVSECIPKPKPVPEPKCKTVQDCKSLNPEPITEQDLAPIIKKVVSQWDQLNQKIRDSDQPKNVPPMNKLPLSIAEDDLKPRVIKTDPDLRILHKLKPPLNSRKNSSSESSNMGKSISKAENHEQENSDRTINCQEAKEEESNLDNYSFLSHKSVLEMTEEDIIRRPFLKRGPLIPFLNNSDSEGEENDLKEEIIKGGVTSNVVSGQDKRDQQSLTEQEIKPHQSTTEQKIKPLQSIPEDENKPKPIPSVLDINPSTRSIKSRLSQEISTFHKVGSPYGGALRTLKTDMVPPRRMAHLKAGTLMDLYNEDKKPQRSTLRNKNNVHPNTNVDLPSNVSENIPKADVNNISHDELKKIVEKNLFDLPTPPNINLLGNTKHFRNDNTAQTTATVSQPDWSNTASTSRPAAGNTSVRSGNISTGWPMMDPRLETGHNASQSRKFSLPGNVLPDSSFASSHNFAEPNSSYKLPVLQNDPSRSPCYDGSSTPDPYRPDPYTQNMSGNSILNSPVYQPRTPLLNMPSSPYSNFNVSQQRAPMLDMPSSPYPQFENYPNANHFSERDTFQRNYSLSHSMMVSENNNMHRSLLGHHPYDRNQHYNQMVRSSSMHPRMGNMYNAYDNRYAKPTPSTYSAWRLEKYGPNSGNQLQQQQPNHNYRWRQPVNVPSEHWTLRDPRRRSVEDNTKTEQEPEKTQDQIPKITKGSTSNQQEPEDSTSHQQEEPEDSTNHQQKSQCSTTNQEQPECSTASQEQLECSTAKQEQQPTAFQNQPELSSANQQQPECSTVNPQQPQVEQISSVENTMSRDINHPEEHRRNSQRGLSRMSLRDRGESRDWAYSRTSERSRTRERSRPRECSRTREPSRPRERSRTRERSRPRERSRTRECSRPRERSGTRERSRPRERSRARGCSRPRERSRTRESSRPRERSRTRGYSRAKEYTPERDQRSKSQRRDCHRRDKSPSYKFNDRLYNSNTSGSNIDEENAQIKTNSDSVKKYRIPKINKAKETDPSQSEGDNVSECSNLSSRDLQSKDESKAIIITSETQSTRGDASPKLDICSTIQDKSNESSQSHQIVSNSNLPCENSETNAENTISNGNVAIDETTRSEEQINAKPDNISALHIEVHLKSDETDSQGVVNYQSDVCSSQTPHNLPHGTQEKSQDDQICEKIDDSIQMKSSQTKNYNDSKAKADDLDTTGNQNSQTTEIKNLKDPIEQSLGSSSPKVSKCELVVDKEVENLKVQNVQPSEISTNDSVIARDIVIPNVEALKSIFGVHLTDDKLKSLQEILNSCQPGESKRPEITEFTTIEPTTTESMTSEPTTAEPNTTEPTTAEPTTTEPRATDSPIKITNSEVKSDAVTSEKDGDLISSGSIYEDPTESELVSGESKLSSSAKSKSRCKKKVKRKALAENKPIAKPKSLVKKSRKFRNELDKLQDDISKYHDSDAIAAASGPRKCRLQKVILAETKQSVQVPQNMPLKEKFKKSTLKKNNNSTKNKRSPSPKYDDSDSSDSDALAALTKKMKAKYEPMILESEAKLKLMQDSENKIGNTAKKDLVTSSNNLNETNNVSKETSVEEKKASFPTDPCSIKEIKSPNLEESVECKDPQSLDESDNTFRKSMAQSVPPKEDCNDNQCVSDSTIDTTEENDTDQSSSINRSTTSAKKSKKRSSWSSGIIKKKPKQKKAEVISKDESSTVTQDSTEVGDLENFDFHDEDGEFDIHLADIHYFQDGDLNPIKCKLCSYKGKNIVSHYTISHPKDEVVISRMSPKVAQLAIKESNLFFQKGIIKTSKFTCRFCRQDFSKQLVFFEHLALHSGEYRHECCKCGYRTSTRSGIVKHFNSVHENLTKVNCRVLYKEPSDKTHLSGFLCSICNFFQLSERNVRRHLILSHDKVDSSCLVKINCSLLGYDNNDFESADSVKDSPAPTEAIGNVLSTMEAHGNQEQTNIEENNDNTVSSDISPLSCGTNQTKEIKKEVEIELPTTGELIEALTAEDIPESADDTHDPGTDMELTPITVEESDYAEESEMGSETKRTLKESITTEELNIDIKTEKPSEIANVVEEPESYEPLVSSVDFDAPLDIKQEELEIIDVAGVIKYIPKRWGHFEPSEHAVDLNHLEEKCKVTYKVKGDQAFASIETRKNCNHNPDVVETLSTKISYSKESTPSATLDLKELIKEKRPIFKISRIENVPSLESEKPDVDSPVRRQQLERSCKLLKSNVDNNLETETDDLDLSFLFKDVDEPSDEELDVGDLNIETTQNDNGLPLYRDQIVRCRESLQNSFRTELDVKEYPFLAPENLNVSEFTYVMQKLVHLNVKPWEVNQEITVGGFKAKSTGGALSFSCQLKIFNKCCEFNTSILNDFGRHVNVSHQSYYWDAVCATCFTIFKDNPDKKTNVNVQNLAFCHLVTEHLCFDTMDGRFTSPRKEELVTPEAPRIRVRRLSGDMLSTPGPSSLFGSEPVPNVTPSPVTPVMTLLPYIPPTADPELQIQLQEYFETDMVSAALSVCKQRVERFKTRTALASMLQENKLRQFYKCMGYNCSFTSNFFNEFAMHLDQHRDIYQLCPRSDSHKGYWKLCAYCGQQKLTNYEFQQHLRNEHGECLLQCDRCFYRAKDVANIQQHNKLEHPNEMLRILQCADLEDIVRPAVAEQHFSYHAPMLKCLKGKCNLVTYMVKRYSTHMLEHLSVDGFAQCNACGETYTDLIPLLSHLKDEHFCGVYQCSYCQYGAQNMEEIKTHLCYEHPANPPRAILRLQHESPEVKQETMKIKVFNRDQSKFAQYIVPLPSTSSIRPRIAEETIRPRITGDRRTGIITVHHHPTTSGITPRPRSALTDPLTICTSSLAPLSAAPVSLAIASTSSLAVPGPSSQGPRLVTAVVPPCPRAVPLRLVSRPTPTTPPARSSDVDTTDTSSASPPETSTDGGTLSSSQGSNSTSVEEAGSLPTATQSQVSNENYFKCGNKNCNFDTSSSAQLSNHLIICDLARQTLRLTCKFCNRGFKVPGSLIEHLRKHGPPRFSCSLCDFKDSVRDKVINHQKTAHQISDSIVVPCDSNRTNVEKDYFVVRPKTKSQNEKRLTIIHKMRKTAKNQTRFSPAELDNIPNASVFNQPLGCTQCEYRTKVRSNLVRHIKQHETGNTVTPQDVVNPVPQKAEKMFDKMMNLAGSSHKKREEEEEDTTCPFKYVSDNKRYKCHMCDYLSLKETILRDHIDIIHKDEPNYICPHCDEKPVSVPTDQLLMHLKLHDCPLFKCSHCSFYSHMRNSIERHQRLSHAGVESLSLVTVRSAKPDEPSGQPAAGSSVPATPPVEAQEEVYACSSCTFRSKTKKLMLTHLASKHKQEKPIRCPLCTHETTTGKAYRLHYAAAHRQDPPLDPIVLYSKVLETKQAPLVPILPLWKRNNKRVKSIRGIVLDEKGDAPPPVLTCTAEDNIQLLDKLEWKFGKYGNPDDKGNMVCPRCGPNGFVTKNKQEMKEHLFRHMDYKPISCSICKIEGVCKKKVEKHLVKLHNIDSSEAAQHMEIKEDYQVEEWVQNVISKQQSEMKGNPSDESDSEKTGKRRRRLSLEDPSQLKQKRAESPATPVSTSAVESSTHPGFSLSETVDPNHITFSSDEFDLSSQDDRLSQDETWEPGTNQRMEPLRQIQLRNRHKCDHCDISTKFKTTLSLHQNNAHPENSKKIIEYPEEKKTEAFNCIYCDCLAFYMHDLKTHWSTTHKTSGLNFIIKRKSARSNLEYQCYLCKKLGNLFTLEEHFILDHPDKSVLVIPVSVPKYKCSECKLVFNSIDILNRHFVMDHPNKDFCFLVVNSQKPFHTPSSELRSVSYKCFTCHFVSGQYKAMVKHVERHYTTYQCQLCDTLFPTVFSIRSHMNTKHPGAETRPVVLSGSKADLDQAKRNILVLCDKGKKRKITEEEIKRGECEDDTPKENSRSLVRDEVKTPSPVNSPVKETARKSTGSPKKSLLHPEKKSSPPKLKMGLRKKTPKLKGNNKTKFALSKFNVECHSRGKKIKFRASTLEKILDLDAKLLLKPVDSVDERT